MSEALDRLLGLFALEEIDVDIFRAPNPDEDSHSRLFGGQVAGQALRAAMATVTADHNVHSLHSYFLLPGRPDHPIVMHVHRIRDGRSFTTRRVVAVQRGEAIFNLAASFHKREPGAEYALPIAADAPEPDASPAGDQRFGHRHRFPFERRELGPSEPRPDGTYASTRRMWIRVSERMPDDERLHACVLTYISDMGMTSAARAPAADERSRFMSASLDHVVWFHRPARVDGWLYFDMRAVSLQGARGLAQGTVHASDGVLVASVSQEALLRPVDAPRPDPAPTEPEEG